MDHHGTTAPRTCRRPLDRGPKLCKICRLTPAMEGLRRCSRVVAESPAMRALLTRAAPIAAADAPVVIAGESGTGKEVLARMLHANSPRKGGPFIAVNVAALPADLLESELFGHAKGAFTGAFAAKTGLIEAARGGTLLLDEIGEMPLSLQVKLLRALNDGEVRRVGDTRAFAVDVRIVCATHCDLEAAIERGTFREDLYYRLKVFTLTVPPLRERREDILPLAELFLELEGRPDARLSPVARGLLEDYPYPGNVRELANVIKHGVALAQEADIDADHLPDTLRSPRSRVRAKAPAPRSPAEILRPLAEVEREHVLRVLEACGGNQVAAARALGIGRNTLWRKLRAYDIDQRE